jgi:hypothetical protein
MTADVIQPSLNRRRESFGGAGLRWPTARGEQFSLQMSSHFSWGGWEARGAMLPSLQPALVEVSRDWVAMVLKTTRKPKKQKSVLDMPPLDLGRVLRPVNGEDDLLQEMLDDTRF